MPLKVLFGPIATATVITAFWFAAMWRGHQTERKRGKPTWQYELGLMGYISALTLFFYLRSDVRAPNGLDIFGMALAAEGMGVGVTIALVQAFVLSRGKPWKERAPSIAGALFLTFIISSMVFAS